MLQNSLNYQSSLPCLYQSFSHASTALLIQKVRPRQIRLNPPVQQSCAIMNFSKTERRLVTTPNREGGLFLRDDASDPLPYNTLLGTLTSSRGCKRIRWVINREQKLNCKLWHNLVSGFLHLIMKFVFSKIDISRTRRMIFKE